jgi:superfamily II DNA or RNA helicase
MSFLPSFRPLVPDHAQARGQQYYRHGKIRFDMATARFVEARVKGTRDYDVSLRVDGARLRVACSCGEASERSLCAHVWGTLLAADTLRHLSDLEAPGRPAPAGPSPRPSRPAQPRHPPAARPPRTAATAPPAWQQELAILGETLAVSAGDLEPWPANREIFYIIDADATMDGLGLVVEVATRTRRASGDWGAFRPCRIAPRQIAMLVDPRDQQVLSSLIGGRVPTYGYHPEGDDDATSRYRLFHPLDRVLLPLMCATGRCRLRVGHEGGSLSELEWDDGEPWRLHLDVVPDAYGHALEIRADLRRAQQTMRLTEPKLLVSGGLVITSHHVARLDDRGTFPWINRLVQEPLLTAPAADRQALVDTLLEMPGLPDVAVPPDLALPEVHPEPHPRLSVRPDTERARTPQRLLIDVAFEYEGLVVADVDPRPRIAQRDPRRLVVRNAGAERLAVERLQRLGVTPVPAHDAWRAQYEVPAARLAALVDTLVGEGWHVEAAGRVYRRPSRMQLDVTSGIDWFELRGRAEFAGGAVDLPRLVAAARKGDRTVTLDDGSIGLLPDEWLARLGMLAGFADAQDDHLRFTSAQGALIEALLESQPSATFDERFRQAREEVRRFGGIQAVEPPAAFTGVLREYQKEGVGWLQFLERFRFGGCLADDMGLGKTVIVLAHLSGRAGRGRPTLVVAPKSLIFNWKQEAARFAPGLRVLDHVGSGRLPPGEHFQDYDLILTTYGTLRRDVVTLRHVHFDWVILDEAQAVKNAATDSARAVRLLAADRRLALSGTPVENHLGELWSLFEFLNPGLLGGAALWHANTSPARTLDEESRRVLARALRPFILRRTKAQVARELPPKVEQTILCELDAPQRAFYRELREYYRKLLLGRIDREGLAKARMHVLEALLRLRQAACHPGLVDPERAAAPSAKLDVLVPQLAEVVEEGHKALVFSQFTSLLALVRERLDALGIRYSYLDGRTRDREARVAEFQHDPRCPLFLVSLKAGGVGLNLTAAGYVFLLDPWWNPAVEAQAIDRTHRIGQSQQVMAYRLIARDTVEQKILELQQQKRDLADAIITADNSALRALTKEDLELLLS